MNHPELKSLSADDPRVCVPIRILVEAPPEDAGQLFNRLFDAAERKFGEWPSFKLVTKEKRLLCAKPRDEPNRRPSRF